MKPVPASFPRKYAFTLVEVLIVIGVISVLSTVAILGIQGVRENSRLKKLENDVATVNSALALYQANGGTLPAGVQPTNIVTLLKQRASAESAAENQVASGSFVDLRLRAIMMDGGEISSDRPRAVFVGGSTNRFVIVTNQVAGVKEFRLDDVEAVADAERTDSLQRGTNGWVWNHSANPPAEGGNLTGAAPVLGSGNGTGLAKLAPPVFSPAGGGVPLASFQPTVQVSINNPNAGGTLLFAGVGNGRQTYTAALELSAGSRITAWVESDDPARWINSDVRSAEFSALPHPLELTWDAPSTVNFLQAGGVIPGLPAAQQAQASLSVNLDGIHPNYLGGTVAEIFATTDGSDPSALAEGSGAQWTPSFSYSIPIFWSDFGNSTQLVLAARAAARSSLFTDSPVASTTISITPISLPGATISPEAPFMLPNWMEMALTEGVHPTGAQIYYTLNGANPINPDGTPAAGASLYSGGFNPEIFQEFTVKTAVVVPSAMRNWFQSEISSANYIVPVGADSSVVGAIVGSGNIDGAFYGSLIFANPAGTVNFNSQGRILGGNLFLPGMPEITVQPNPGTVVLRGQPYVAGATIPRNVIGGKEYNTEGQLANPQTDLRQIVDLAGNAEPANYLFRFNANSYLDGKVFRRANPPEFPVVTLPTGLPTRGSVDLKSNSSPPARTLIGGDYSSIAINADNNIIRLGVANSTEPVEYIFRNANFNKGRIEIIGPARLYFPNGFNVSGTVVGNIDNPGLLEIEVASGSVNVNSSGTLAARLTAPASTVSLNGIFRGTLIARELRVNGNGVAFTLPPIIEGTEEPTPTPTP